MSLTRQICCRDTSTRLTFDTRSSNSYSAIQYTPVDSIATVSTLHCLKRQFGLSRLRKSKVKLERGLFGLMAISNQSTQHVHDEINEATMAGVLNLRNVLQLVNYRFDDRSLAH